MSMRSRRFAEAMELLEAGCAQDALRIGMELVESPGSDSKMSGYLCLAYVYEDGGAGVKQNLERSLYYFRNASLLVEDGDALCNIARIFFKMGDFNSCLNYLQKAEMYNLSPIVLLGFAHYYRFKSRPEISTSKRYYLRAAMRGRFAGFFGYAELARQSGQTLRALGVDVARVTFGWAIALLIGGKALDRFI